MTKYEMVKEFAPKRYTEQEIKKIASKGSKEKLEKIYEFWSKSKQEQADKNFCWALV